MSRVLKKFTVNLEIDRVVSTALLCAWIQIFWTKDTSEVGKIQPTLS